MHVKKTNVATLRESLKFQFLNIPMYCQSEHIKQVAQNARQKKMRRQTLPTESQPTVQEISVSFVPFPKFNNFVVAQRPWNWILAYAAPS